MPAFSNNSQAQLLTCHELLIELAEEVVRWWDCSVLEGFRDADKQNRMYETGRSKHRFPFGKHNTYPSQAFDLAPYGCWGPERPNIVWPDRDEATYVKDLATWYRFGGFVHGVAVEMGILVRWGGDWNGNFDVSDQRFDDLGHFELRKLEQMT